MAPYFTRHAFARFSTFVEAARAIKEGNNRRIDGFYIKVYMGKEKNNFGRSNITASSQRLSPSMRMNDTGLMRKIRKATAVFSRNTKEVIEDPSFNDSCFGNEKNKL
ncbi:hypothetical protein V6N13_142109 [Hibiscus sabdariffa]|uniref:RRM domain-containing protein n=1 Tax=Hibiscus sabdariffa TaxID=183260 RepID=A0ABR2FD90_9ROSI